MVILSSSALVVAIDLFSTAAFFAWQPHAGGWNWYEMMRDAGLRRSDSISARSGMIHDQAFRASLAGISEGELERLFPGTFYKLQSPPPSAKRNQVYYIDSYFQSETGAHLRGPCWIAIFEDGRLISLEYDKGI